MIVIGICARHTEQLGVVFNPFLDARGAVIVLAGEERVVLCDRTPSDGIVAITSYVTRFMKDNADTPGCPVDRGDNHLPRAVVDGGCPIVCNVDSGEPDAHY
jgi:hypothetical protein